MGLDRIERQIEPVADLPVGESLGNELEHLEFAFAQRLNLIQFGTFRLWEQSILVWKREKQPTLDGVIKAAGWREPGFDSSFSFCFHPFDESIR